MDSLLKDIRYAMRGLLKRPGFTAVAVITLALGIGANAAIFSAVHSVLLRALPFSEQDRLVVVWKHEQTSNQPLVELSIPEFNDWRSQCSSFESMTAMPTSVYGYGYVLTGRGEPVQIESARVSADFFSTLGVRPLLGRALHLTTTARAPACRDSQRSPAAPAPMRMLSVGQTISLNDTGFSVIGVMAANFEFPKGADIWSLCQPRRVAVPLQNRERSFQMVGRLKPGITMRRLRLNLTPLSPASPLNIRDGSRTTSRGHYTLMGYIFGTRELPLVAARATGLLLLIACANVANCCWLVRPRRREIAAWPACKPRTDRAPAIHRELALAVAGAFLGVLIAYWLIDLFILVAPFDIPRLEGVGINGAVLAFTAGSSLLTAVIFGLIPALTVSKVNVADVLNEGGRTIGERQGNRLRSLLVVAEVAVTVVLLIGAGLILRSFIKLQQVDAGFDRNNILTFQLRLHGKKYSDQKSVADFYQQLIERLETQPGVIAAGAVLIRPLEGVIG